MKLRDDFKGSRVTLALAGLGRGRATSQFKLTAPKGWAMSDTDMDDAATIRWRITDNTGDVWWLAISRSELVTH